MIANTVPYLLWLLSLVQLVYCTRAVPTELSGASQRIFARYGPKYGPFSLSALALQRAILVSGVRPTAGSGESSNNVDETSGCFRGVVLLTIANKPVMQSLMPAMLMGLQRQTHSIRRSDASGVATTTLDQHIIAYGVDRAANHSCTALNAQYGHACACEGEAVVLQPESVAAQGSSALASYGFMKARLLLNLLSAGVDVLYLDADMAVLQNPLTYVLPGLGDIVSGASYDKASGAVYPPGEPVALADTGVLYLRARASVSRCLYNLMVTMWSHAHNRTAVAEGAATASARMREPAVWARAMLPCARTFRLNVTTLGPKVLVVLQEDACGTVAEGAPAVPPDACLAHVRCGGGLNRRAAVMRQLQAAYARA